MFPRHQRTQEVDLVIQALAGDKPLDAVINTGVVGQAGKLHIGRLHTGGGNELAPLGGLGILRVGEQRVILVVGIGKAPEHILGHGKVHLGRACATVGLDARGSVHPVIIQVIPNLV